MNKNWKIIKYNINIDKNQYECIISDFKITSNIGEIIGIGIKNKRKYRYSDTKKYENRIIDTENKEMIIPGVALNNMEDKEEIDKEVPIETTKNGINILICILILYWLNA